MSIMDQFRSFIGNGGQQNPNAPSQQISPGNLPQQQPLMMQNSDGSVPNPATIPAGGVVNTVEPPKSPMDDFNKLWEPIKTEAANGAVTFNIDPTKINAAAAGIDFTKSIPPELLTKIQAGGPDAMVAMMQALNIVGQQSFAQSTMSNARVVETALAKARENMHPEIQTLVRNEQIANTMRADNPLYSNPAIAPVLTLLEKQFAATFPTATPAELKQKAQTYFVSMAGEINKAYVPVIADPAATKETDWSSFGQSQSMFS